MFFQFSKRKYTGVHEITEHEMHARCLYHGSMLLARKIAKFDIKLFFQLFFLAYVFTEFEITSHKRSFRHFVQKCQPTRFHIKITRCKQTKQNQNK